jgi:hypothetical protein
VFWPALGSGAHSRSEAILPIFSQFDLTRLLSTFAESMRRVVFLLLIGFFHVTYSTYA